MGILTYPPPTPENIRPGDRVLTTIGACDIRLGITIEVKEIQTDIEANIVEIRGPSVLQKGDYGKRDYIYRMNA